MLVTCCVGGCFKLFNLVNMVLVSLIFLSNDNDLVIILSTLLLLMSMLSIVGTFSLPMSAYRSQTDVVRTDSITNIAWQFSNWMLWHNITLSTYKLRILMFLVLVVFCSTPMPSELRVRFNLCSCGYVYYNVSLSRGAFELSVISTKVFALYFVCVATFLFSLNHFRRTNVSLSMVSMAVCVCVRTFQYSNIRRFYSRYSTLLFVLINNNWIIRKMSVKFKCKWCSFLVYDVYSHVKFSIAQNGCQHNIFQLN